MNIKYFLGVLIFPTALFGMSLTEFAANSLRCNLSNLSDRETVLAKASVEKASWGLWLPGVELRTAVAHSNVDFNQTASFLDESQSSNIFALIARQKILDKGAYEDTRSAVLAKKAQDLLYEKNKQQILLQVAGLYFDVLTAKESIEVAKQVQRLTKEVYDLTKKNEALGVVTSSALASANAQKYTAMAKLLRAEQNYRHLLNYLNQLAQTDHQTVNPLKGSDIFKEKTTHSLKEWKNLALKNNLELRAGRYGLLIAKSQIKKAAGEDWPKINAYAGYTQGKNVIPLDPTLLVLTGLQNVPNIEYKGATVGVQMNMYLFTGGAVNNTIKEKYHLYQNQLLKLKDASEKLVLQVEEYYDNLSLYHLDLSQTKLAVKANKEELRAQRLELSQGNITPTKFLEARNRYQESLLQEALARNNYVKNLLNLYYVAGILDLNKMQEIG